MQYEIMAGDGRGTLNSGFSKSMINNYRRNKAILVITLQQKIV
jgi:hypothetical protein